MGLLFNATPLPLYPRERQSVHCIGDWVGPRVGMDGVENLFLSGIRSTGRPVRSKSLYRVCYPGLLFVNNIR
jgi:hypothetical protein